MSLLTRWTGLRQFGYLASTVILVVFFPLVLEHKDLLFPKVGLKIRLQPPVASVDSASQLLIVSVVCAKEPPRGEACEPALRFNSQPISREDLPEALRWALLRRADRLVYVEGDRRLNLNDVAGVIDLARGVWRDVPVVLLTPELKRTLIKAPLSGKSPVDGAQIKIWNPETEVEFHAVSTGGRYSFPEIPPGEYLVRVAHPDKAPFLGAIRVNAESHHEFDLALSNARGRPSEVLAEAPAFPGPTSEKAKPATNTVKPSHVLPQRMPGPKLRLPYGLRIGGVQMAAVIRTDGTVDDLIVLSAPNEELALAALKVVRQWRYSPTYLNGVAVEVRTLVDLRWH